MEEEESELRLAAKSPFPSPCALFTMPLPWADLCHMNPILGQTENLLAMIQDRAVTNIHLLSSWLNLEMLYASNKDVPVHQFWIANSLADAGLGGRIRGIFREAFMTRNSISIPWASCSQERYWEAAPLLLSFSQSCWVPTRAQVVKEQNTANTSARQVDAIIPSQGRVHSLHGAFCLAEIALTPATVHWDSCHPEMLFSRGKQIWGLPNMRSFWQKRSGPGPGPRYFCTIDWGSVSIYIFLKLWQEEKSFHSLLSWKKRNNSMTFSNQIFSLLFQKTVSICFSICSV